MSFVERSRGPDGPEKVSDDMTFPYAILAFAFADGEAS